MVIPANLTESLYWFPDVLDPSPSIPSSQAKGRNEFRWDYTAAASYKSLNNSQLTLNESGSFVDVMLADAL
jgi:hypothetical protein